ncbi:hypothetical protein GYH30_029645 [Glycine max]|nr:hypothetical protein GYH30_029645 [Glycine max]
MKQRKNGGRAESGDAQRLGCQDLCADEFLEWTLDSVPVTLNSELSL